MTDFSQKRAGIFLFVLQLVFLVMFGLFSTYETVAQANPNPKPNTTSTNGGAFNARYPLFQDVNVMIFVGFGFLMTFLKKYGFSAVGFNFLLSIVAIQWSIIVNGLISMWHENTKTFAVGLDTLIDGDFGAAVVLISFGVLLGKTSPFQLVIMVLIEIPFYAANFYMGNNILKAVDAGGSMFIHAFGAYFGLACSFIFRERCLVGGEQERTTINTYFSLSACVITALATSILTSKEAKINMVHVQNATLAGGVAVGTMANHMIHPVGAAVVGSVAGVLSTVGYAYLTPLLAEKVGLHDTCGVHNLHGMPGILSGLGGIVTSGLATLSVYGEGSSVFPEIKTGGRTGATQAGFQAMALALTLGIAIFSGVLTGVVLRFLNALIQVPASRGFDDDPFWELPHTDDPEDKNDEQCYQIPMNLPYQNNSQNDITQSTRTLDQTM